ISNCDKVTPGMLMAAARLNVPAISVTGGPMESGILNGQKVGVNNVFEAVGKVFAGKMTAEESALLENVACPGCGSCNGMFTANTMACMTEALGMSLPYCATALANGAGSKLSLSAYDEIGRKVPHLCNMVPTGNFDMADLGNAGGLPALIKELKPFVHFDALTVTGKTVGENVAEAKVINADVIR